MQLEALAVVRPELLETRGVAADVPADLREGLGQRSEICLEGGGVHAERPVDAAPEVAGGGADPVVEVERIADLGPGPREAAELPGPEARAAGQRPDNG